MQNSNSSGRLPAQTVFVRTCLTPLLTTTKPYISDDYLDKFQVECHRLDLFSGLAVRRGTQQPDPQSRAFTRPMPLEDVRSAIETNRAWISPTYGYPELLLWGEKIDNWWQAFQIAEHLDMYLRSNCDPWKSGLIRTTGWQGLRLAARLA